MKRSYTPEQREKAVKLVLNDTVIILKATEDGSRSYTSLIELLGYK